MYAITGITGKVGGAMGRALLKDGKKVRAIVRDPRRGEAWSALGCDVAVADMADAAALTDALQGATGVFILLPPVFDPAPGYPETKAVIAAVVRALKAASPDKVLQLSTIGTDVQRDNLLSQLAMMEAGLVELSLPLTILRPAWFIDNAAWDIAAARDEGVLHSFLAPLDKTFPMVAAKDVGETAAELIQQDWTGTRIVELEGPRRVSANELAAAFTRALGKPVEGWIDFPDHGKTARKGPTTVEEVVAGLVAAT